MPPTPLESTAHCNNHYMYTCVCHFRVTAIMVKAHALFWSFYIICGQTGPTGNSYTGATPIQQYARHCKLLNYRRGKICFELLVSNVNSHIQHGDVNKSRLATP